METLYFNKKETDPQIISELLKKNMIGIIPCDTIYGISAKVNEETSEKIYELKKRKEGKRFITLTSLSYAMANYNIPQKILNSWPAPLTAIVNHDGGTIALRVPNDEYLDELFNYVPSIFSTSVNMSGEPALTDIDEIIKEFDGKVDFILIDQKEQSTISSTIVDCTNSDIKIIREGAFRFR